MIKILIILMTLTQFQTALELKVQDNHKKFIKEYQMTGLESKEDFTVAMVNAQAERIKELEEQLKQKEDFAIVISMVSDAKNKIARDNGYLDWKELQEDYNGVEVVYAWDLYEIYKSIIDSFASEN